MAKLFGLAEQELWDRFNDAMENTVWGQLLIPEEIRFEILAVTTDGPSALARGALAMIKVVGPEERSRGGPDCRILVDLIQYQSFERARQREAIFAHEIFHIEMTRKKSGEVRRDAYDRPRFKMKKDHWYITGFHDVWSQYRDDSIEQDSYNRMGEAFQLTSIQYAMGLRFPTENPNDFLPLAVTPEENTRTPAMTVEVKIIKPAPPVEPDPKPTREELKAAINEEFSQGTKEREAELEGASDDEAARTLRAEWVEAAKPTAKPATDPAAAVIQQMRGALSAYNAWRDISLTTAIPGLGTTITIIWSHDVRTVGELVFRGGGKWSLFSAGNEAMQARGFEIDVALDRFRATLNDAQGADYDALASGLVEKVEDPKPKKDRKPRAAKAPKPEPMPADEPEAEAWRYLLVSELNLPEKVAEDLQASEIETMGELVAMISRFSHTMPAGALLIVNDALDRFDGTLTEAQIATFRAARFNVPADAMPVRRPKREAAGV